MSAEQRSGNASQNRTQSEWSREDKPDDGLTGKAPQGLTDWVERVECEHCNGLGKNAGSEYAAWDGTCAYCKGTGEVCVWEPYESDPSGDAEDE